LAKSGWGVNILRNARLGLATVLEEVNIMMGNGFDHTWGWVGGPGMLAWIAIWAAVIALITFLAVKVVRHEPK
jgi:hypothetical protein